MTPVVVLGLLYALLFSQPPRATQLELPAAGQVAAEQTLAPGQVHEWLLELADAEWLAITIEPLDLHEADEWPRISVTTADGRPLYDSDQPQLAPGVESWSCAVVSLIADHAGPHRLQVATRGSPFRYQLRVRSRRPAVEADRQRLAAQALWREGMRRFMGGSPDELRGAIDQFTASLGRLESIADEESLEDQALTLGTLAFLQYRLSDAAQGKIAAQRALDLWRRLGREREEAKALSDLGLLAYLGYDHAGARRYYEQALPKQRDLGDVQGEAMTLSRLGWVHYAAAELSQAVDVNSQALQLYRRVGNRVGESLAFNDLGRAYNDLGEMSQALDALRQALALRPPDRDPRGAANVLIRIGLVSFTVADWQRAMDALRQARQLAQRVHDARVEAAALVNLGSAYSTVGDNAEATRALESALAIAKSIDFRNAQAYALLWLGVTETVQGDLQPARDHLQQALAIQSALKDIRGQVTTLRQLAIVQLRLGEPRRALESINRSVELTPQASGIVYSGALTQASVYAALGDAERATAHYEESLARFRSIRARHGELLTLTQFARFEAGRGRHAEARALLEQALPIHDSLRGLIVDPDLRMSYASSLDAYRLYVDVLMQLAQGSPDANLSALAFHANERARARGLLDLLSTSGVDIRQGVDRTLVERERSLRWNLNAKAALQTSLLAGARASDDRRLATLENEIAELSRAWRETTTEIRRQSPGYASLTEPQPLTAQDVRGLLDANTVLLEYAPGDTHGWLFAITATSVESFALPPWRTIDDAAREFHRLLAARQQLPDENPDDRWARIQQADAALDERGQALSDLVLGPIAARLATDWRGRRLAIVSAGALEYVPFAALPFPTTTGNIANHRAASPSGSRVNGGSGGVRTVNGGLGGARVVGGPVGGGRGGAESVPRRLIAGHELVTLPSASSLALLRNADARRGRAGRTIAVIADPVFAADDPRVRMKRTAGATDAASSARPDSFARLPFTRAEARAIATLVPASQRLQATDFDASLALATSDRLRDYRIVHFATHGVIDTTRPELSGLALSLVDANGRDQDGFLRLNTIYNLRLSADLVVLSACQTALGKEVASEGLVGLTRGFMYAGTPRVIASLWQVSDVATAELMKTFYANILQRKLPASAALREAQLAMSRKPHWAAPYFWAGFVLQGDWQE